MPIFEAGVTVVIFFEAMDLWLPSCGMQAVAEALTRTFQKARKIVKCIHIRSTRILQPYIHICIIYVARIIIEILPLKKGNSRHCFFWVFLWRKNVWHFNARIFTVYEFQGRYFLSFAISLCLHCGIIEILMHILGVFLKRASWLIPEKRKSFIHTSK